MDKDQYAVLKTRRQFLRQIGCGAMGTVALTNVITKLRLMNAAVAQSIGDYSDYKALVCIFLQGGNDSNNLIIPYDNTAYAAYATPRGGVFNATTNPYTLAIPQANLTNTLTIGSSDPNYGHSLAFHPACPELATLFNSGKLATLFNTGSLAYPITLREYQNGSVPQPPQLYSHSDQQAEWQTAIPDQPPTTGWAGRCADLLNASNTANGGQISLCSTVAGSNIFEIGSQTTQYAVSTNGAITAQYPSTTGTPTRQQALQNILGLGQSSSHLQLQAYSSVLYGGLASSTVLGTAIASVANGGGVPNATYSALYGTNGTNGTYFKPSITNPAGGTFNSSIMSQLQMVARLIDAGNRATASGGLGMRRQIFFVQVGGYDTHTNQVTNGAVTQGAQSNLLADLSQGINQFLAAMTFLGLSNNVTCFTASDFSRTFQFNGQGSDHGWGSHHLIAGGAVVGGKTYGTWPVLQLGGPIDTGTGRWIPSTSVDQYSSTLASWFGITNTYLSTVFPNLGRFAAAPAFMNNALG